MTNYTELMEQGYEEMLQHVEELVGEEVPEVIQTLLMAAYTHGLNVGVYLMELSEQEGRTKGQEDALKILEKMFGIKPE